MVWQWLAESIVVDVLALTTPMTRGELLMILFAIFVVGFCTGVGFVAWPSRR